MPRVSKVHLLLFLGHFASQKYNTKDSRISKESVTTDQIIAQGNLERNGTQFGKLKFRQNQKWLRKVSIVLSEN